MSQDYRRFRRGFRQLRELQRQAKGFISRMEKDRGIKLDRFLYQPYY
jgi:hypothetical protein